LLQHRVHALHLRAATGDDDVAQGGGHGVGGRAGDQLADAHVEFVEEGVADRADSLAQFDVAGLASHDEFGLERLAHRADVGVSLLELPDVMAGEAGVRVGALDQIGQLAINRVARVRDADLVLGTGEVALHEAEVSRPAADVDDQGVDHGIHVFGLAEA